MGAGTVTHLLLANEAHNLVLAFIESPLTERLLDPTKCDGEKKTIPIIAAKVRAEAVLLALADIYPDKLAINAQDAQDRTVMHYCFGLGLIEAARRYMELEPNLEIRDHKGQNVQDYLNLSSEETDDSLRSIEIHPQRDAGARRNHIIGQIKGSLPVLIDGRPQLVTRANFTDRLTIAAYEQFGIEGVQLIAKQSRLRGISLQHEISVQRTQLKYEYDSGLLVPKKGIRRPKRTPRRHRTLG